MSSFTERNNMRDSVERTEIISIDMYALLFDCCQRYFDNIAWKFSQKCPDGNVCCGLDEELLNNALRFEIPNLYKGSNDNITKPEKGYLSGGAQFDQYALLDFIEFIAENLKDIIQKKYHEFYKHDDFSHRDTRNIFETFQDEINKTFSQTGLLYTITDSGTIERVVEYGVSSNDIATIVNIVPEPVTKELLNEALALFRKPDPVDRKNAVEKIWDALERLKTYYVNDELDKKNSIRKIATDMAVGQSELYTLFDTEFKALTEIGNKFRIRHHETNQTDITDTKHYDYFFNRCLSLIALALQYLI